MDVNEEALVSGSIGLATRGDMQGYYVRVDRYSDSPTAWVLYWRDPNRELESDEDIGTVAGDRIIPSPEDLREMVVQELRVRWLGTVESDEIRARYFSFIEPDAVPSRAARWRRRRR